MAGRSEQDDREEVSPAPRPPGIPAGSGLQAPAETAEPQPGAVGAAGEGVSAAEPAEAAPGQRGPQVPAEPEVVAAAGPEPPATREPGRAAEELGAEEAGRQGAPAPGAAQAGPAGAAGPGRAGSLAGSEPAPDAAEQALQRLQERQLRSELLAQYRSLMGERSSYQRYNIWLQHKVSEALRKKGLDAGEAPGAPEREQAYLSGLAVLEELRKQEADDLRWYHRELRQLQQQCQDKRSAVRAQWRRFQALKKQVVLQAMGSCRAAGGRQAALREVERVQALEDQKEQEMSALRLQNVQLKHGLVHFETRMRAQKDTGEGLLLIDFEQLKIENQTFNEKVEERNEELLKLRNKVNNNVQVVTHVKEKLHFVDTENAGRTSQLVATEAQLTLGREILTRTKQARDRLRADNVRLHQRCGLLGRDSLLRDMEEKVGNTELLRQRVESLKRHHAGLTLSCRGVRQKIREAKAFLPP